MIKGDVNNMDNIISKKETKETTFFQGEYRNCNQDRKRELETELLFFIKENVSFPKS